MSENDERWVADPSIPAPDVAEEYAEQVGVDPTHDQIDRYLELEGEEPLGEERPLPG